MENKVYHQNDQSKKKFNVNQIVIMGLLIAMDVVLTRFLSIQTPITRIGFSFVARAMAAIILGPWCAACAGGIADIIGMLAFPSGAYFPGFTLTAAMTGFIFGLFMHKKVTPVRIIGAVVVNQLICSLGLNTLWLMIMTESSFFALLSTRVLQAVVTGAVQIVTIMVLQGAFVVMKRQLPNAG